MAPSRSFPHPRLCLNLSGELAQEDDMNQALSNQWIPPGSSQNPTSLPNGSVHPLLTDGFLHMKRSILNTIMGTYHAVLELMPKLMPKLMVTVTILELGPF